MCRPSLVFSAGLTAQLVVILQATEASLEHKVAVLHPVHTRNCGEDNHHISLGLFLNTLANLENNTDLFTTVHVKNNVVGHQVLMET